MIAEPPQDLQQVFAAHVVGGALHTCRKLGVAVAVLAQTGIRLHPTGSTVRTSEPAVATPNIFEGGFGELAHMIVRSMLECESASERQGSHHFSGV